MLKKIFKSAKARTKIKMQGMKYNQNFCEKYRAKCFADIKGQDITISRLNAFIKRFPLRKAIILHGATGTGKTSLAYALASEMKAEILELNASDLRNRAMLEAVLKPAIEQQSLFSKNKVILVDEVDGINADRGGLPELIALIEKTNFPIIITANNIWSQKFNLLRQKCELVELKGVHYETILEILSSIAIKEAIETEADLLRSIAIKCKGDIRAAINDLQTLAFKAKAEQGDIGERNKEESIFDMMRAVFKSRATPELLSVYENTDMPIDDIFLWIEENIPREYEGKNNGKELAKAFNALSLADVFRGRIHRQQHWRFLVYQNAFLSAGIAAAKKNARNDFTKYSKPTRILKIWLSNQKNAKRKEILARYAHATHCSKKRARKEFSVLKLFITKDDRIKKELKLSEDEVMFLERKW